MTQQARDAPPSEPAHTARAPGAEEHGAGATLRFVTRKWPPAVGGMETYSKRLVEQLSETFAVETIALPGRANGAAPGGARLLLFGITTALRLLVSRPAQVTHLGDLALWPLGVFARLRAGNRRLAISLHGTDVYFAAGQGFLPRLYRAYLRLGARLLPRASLIANSRATAALAARYGWRDISVVPLATDMTPVLSGSTGQQVFFAGRIMRRKGCGWFIREVLPLLPDDIRLRVAGTVWEPPEAALLENDRVEFIGPVYGADLAREYASAVCVIVPTLDFEGFGLTASEAAAAGGVVLAADHSGLRDAVLDGETGFLVSIDSAGDWAAKIGEIRAWPESRRDSFVKHASVRARRHYSWERVARDTLAAYRL